MIFLSQGTTRFPERNLSSADFFVTATIITEVGILLPSSMRGRAEDGGSMFL
jgi:hypothetical protein